MPAFAKSGLRAREESEFDSCSEEAEVMGSCRVDGSRGAGCAGTGALLEDK